VPARIVYAGREARRVHENLGYSKDRGVVVDNGVDLGKFRRDATMRKVARRFLDAQPSNYVIGMIGRFDGQKDHSTMIRAFAKVREHRDAVLAIVGPDCTLSNERLGSLIRSAGVEPHVRLLGQRPDIATLMNGFDVLAISSRYGEAIPMVALEAAATDLPVVATRVGDVGEFLLDDRHLACPGVPGSLASALLDVAQCLPFPAALVEKRRRKLKAKYSIECMAHNYLALYRALTIRYPRVQSASQLSPLT
jgi:glycosyltransferase involved in cell wall biosynthesis